MSDPVPQASLEDAREKAQLVLNEKEKRRDWKTYGRQTPGPGVLVAQKLMLVTQGQIQIDLDTLRRSEDAGQDCNNINSAHPAYPIITKKVKKVIYNQVIHCLNGCLDPKGRLSHVETGQRNYRNTGIFLPTYSSPFGTSRCETFHSAAASHFTPFWNINQYTFEARALWKVTHYNRRKLSLIMETIPPGLAPSEFEGARLIPEGRLKPSHFGFDYCQMVLAKKNNRIYKDILAEFNPEKPKDSELVADLELDDCDEEEDATTRRALPSDDMDDYLDGEAGPSDGFDVDSLATADVAEMGRAVLREIDKIDEVCAITPSTQTTPPTRTNESEENNGVITHPTRAKDSEENDGVVSTITPPAQTTPPTRKRSRRRTMALMALIVLIVL